MRLPVEDISVVLKIFPEFPFDHSSFQHISTQEVCHMAFWYVTVVKPESLPSKLSPLKTWCTDILSIDHRSGFQSSWCGPLSGSVYWGEPPRMMQPQPPGHQAVSFRLRDPAKESPTFHWHSKHSQPIDTMARWGRTSAEYNSLFCIPFSELLIPGWISTKSPNFYLTLTLQVEHLQKNDVYILPRKPVRNLKIPPWKRRNIYKTSNYWVPCSFSRVQILSWIIFYLFIYIYIYGSKFPRNTPRNVWIWSWPMPMAEFWALNVYWATSIFPIAASEPQWNSVGNVNWCWS